MRVSSHILSFFCFIFLVISSAKSQSEWNLHRIKTEIMKMNEKFKFLSDQIDDFKINLNNNSGLNQDQLTKHLDLWKQDLQSQITNLKQQLLHKLDRDQLLSELQPSKSEMDSVKKELKDLSVKLGQEVSDSESQKLEVEQLKLEKNSMKKELNTLGIKLEQEVSSSESQNLKQKLEVEQLKKELNALNVKLEQKVSDSKQGEEALKKAIVRFEEELSEMKKKDVSLESSIALTKPHIFKKYLGSLDMYEIGEASFVWKINDIKNKVKQSNLELLSEVFPLKGYSFGAQAKLTLNSNNLIEMRLAFKDMYNNSNDQASLNLKLIPAVYYTYKDPSSSKFKIIHRQCNYHFANTLQYDSFNYNTWILSTYNLVSDTLSIDIRVDSPEIIEEGYSYDGTLIWAINDFRKKREMERNQAVFKRLSPYFYTSPKGYRVQAEIRLDRYNEQNGKGLSMSLEFLTGPYDSSLGHSFKHKTTITLLHPTDPTKHLVKSAIKDLKDGKWYTINMGTNAEIEALLDNDTLYYQIKIAPA